jgi:hypothetical protein
MEQLANVYPRSPARPGPGPGPGGYRQVIPRASPTVDGASVSRYDNEPMPDLYRPAAERVHVMQFHNRMPPPMPHSGGQHPYGHSRSERALPTNPSPQPPQMQSWPAQNPFAASTGCAAVLTCCVDNIRASSPVFDGGD